MVRVTRPAGRIVVFGFDWDTPIIDLPDKETPDRCPDLLRSLQTGGSVASYRGYSIRRPPRGDRRVECDHETCEHSRLPLYLYVPSRSP